MSRHPMSDEQDLLYPLSEFYLLDGLILPGVMRIDGQQMPEPYKTLLVHETDMTSTLEEYHDKRLRLHLLRRHHERDEYSRQVLLVAERDQKPTEFGAIKIFLQNFPEKVRQQILKERRPLGTILSAEQIPYTSRPVAFVQITPDPMIRGALGLGETQLVFGRRNVLIDPSQRVLADILEVLPPC
jgi:chorismate-pyruvate lyase